MKPMGGGTTSSDPRGDAIYASARFDRRIKLRMVEAAKKALQSLGQPASVRAIHKEITKHGLFEFGAKDPVSVLGSAIRRRTKGSKSLRGPELFESTGSGTYRLL